MQYLFSLSTAFAVSHCMLAKVISISELSFHSEFGNAISERLDPDWMHAQTERKISAYLFQFMNRICCFPIIVCILIAFNLSWNSVNPFLKDLMQIQTNRKKNIACIPRFSLSIAFLGFPLYHGEIDFDL